MYALFKSRKQKQIGNPNWKIDKKPKKEKLLTAKNNNTKNMITFVEIYDSFKAFKIYVFYMFYTQQISKKKP